MDVKLFTVVLICMFLIKDVTTYQNSALEKLVLGEHRKNQLVVDAGTGETSRLRNLFKRAWNYCYACGYSTKKESHEFEENPVKDSNSDLWKKLKNLLGKKK